MRRLASGFAGLTFAFALAACGQASGEAHDHAGEAAAFDENTASCASGEPPPPIGLMTSLPLVWPLDASFEEMANGTAQRPWQAVAISQCYTVMPLDTLSPIEGLSPDDPETDPLAGLERLAVIQPRGLSPADNVALDEWVRAGGQLLLVLDPMLTGHYELPVGDPRRPTDTALIPPVVERWGVAISFDAEQDEQPYLDWVGGEQSTFHLTGQVSTLEPENEDCGVFARDVIASCSVGEGWVTIIADAAQFEGVHEGEIRAGQQAAALQAIFAYSFQGYGLGK